MNETSTQTLARWFFGPRVPHLSNVLDFHITSLFVPHNITSTSSVDLLAYCAASSTSSALVTCVFLESFRVSWVVGDWVKSYTLKLASVRGNTLGACFTHTAPTWSLSDGGVLLNFYFQVIGLVQPLMYKNEVSWPLMLHNWRYPFHLSLLLFRGLPQQEQRQLEIAVRPSISCSVVSQGHCAEKSSIIPTSQWEFAVVKGLNWR